MKRILSTYPLVIATLFIIAFSALPHHHHKEVLCMVMELCEQDNTYNDDHTEHGTDRDEHHQTACVSSVDYISSSSITKSSLDSENGISLHLPVIFLLADILALDFSASEPETTYDGYVVSYTSVVLGESCGLRVPPFYLS
ncbi:DUF6769 family protein [Bacteroides cellulosilyticus]|jgi:hypothetical protein|uniref:DUF6769 family protein n=1 Tax=Bacteroides cellulosilyticus TaxID=246787 RepID=UPI0022DEBDAC|nr:DUF6769 family protein [Bacteroides cellulosilyticus]